MSRITFNCEHCGTNLAAPIAAKGKHAICKGCKQKVLIPDPSDRTPSGLSGSFPPEFWEASQASDEIDPSFSDLATFQVSEKPLPRFPKTRLRPEPPDDPAPHASPALPNRHYGQQPTRVAQKFGPLHTIATLHIRLAVIVAVLYTVGAVLAIAAVWSASPEDHEIDRPLLTLEILGASVLLLASLVPALTIGYVLRLLLSMEEQTRRAAAILERGNR